MSQGQNPQNIMSLLMQLFGQQTPQGQMPPQQQMPPQGQQQMPQAVSNQLNPQAWNAMGLNPQAQQMPAALGNTGMGLASNTQSSFPGLPGYVAPQAGQLTPEQQMMQRLTGSMTPQAMGSVGSVPPTSGGANRVG